MSTIIYMDYAASTPCDPKVLKEIIPFYIDKFANPSNTTNSLGKEANYAVELARNKIAKLLNCYPQNIIWTSGATESNNIAIQGVIKKYKNKNPYLKGHIITSSIEHKSVLETVKSLDNIDISFIKPNRDGITSLEEIDKNIKPNTFFISLMMANNELGVLNDLLGLSKLCKDKGIILHTDATQAIGKIAIDLNHLELDLLSLSGHKIYAPKGIGALYIGNPDLISPLYFGGGHENGLRPGTLNVPGIVGLGVASEICYLNLQEENTRIRILKDKFENELLKINDNIIINGKNSDRLSNISNISFPFKKGLGILNNLTSIACSSGSACDTPDNLPSHVLFGIGKSRQEAKNTIRFSLGRFTNEEDISLAINHIKNLF